MLSESKWEAAVLCESKWEAAELCESQWETTVLCESKGETAVPCESKWEPLFSVRGCSRQLLPVRAEQLRGNYDMCEQVGSLWPLWKPHILCSL